MLYNFGAPNGSQKTFIRNHEIRSLHFNFCTVCFLMHQSFLFRLHNFTFANSSRNISSDISISIHFLCNLSVRFHGQSTAGHSNRGLKRPTFLAMIWESSRLKNPKKKMCTRRAEGTERGLTVRLALFAKVFSHSSIFGSIPQTGAYLITQILAYSFGNSKPFPSQGG